MGKIESIWPEGKRIVVALTFSLESWSEGKAPPYSPMASPPKAGALDLAGIRWSEYGARAGGYRLMRICKQHNVPATFCVNARVAELFPAVVKQIVASGFELAAHNYAQDQVLSGLTEAEERGVIQRCIKILEEVSGVRSCGWLSATLATTERTPEILAQEGMLWHGDYNYIDLPFRLKTRRGTIVALPHSDYADNRVLRGAPRDWYQCYKDMFDYLYHQEPNSLVNIAIHGHFGGRPLVSAVFDELLRYINGHPGVWFARHDEIARWVNDQKIDEITYLERFPL